MNIIKGVVLLVCMFVMVVLALVYNSPGCGLAATVFLFVGVTALMTDDETSSTR